MMNTLPPLFVSHGAPLFAVDAGTTGPALKTWASQHAKPKAIVVMSPHWMARRLAVMSTPQPQTWHDFGGFPPELYQLQYPAPGEPALALKTLQLLQAAGLDAVADDRRPFDHGTWVPLMHLYPEADIPVIQVALPVQAGPKEVYEIGRALQPLQEEGVLLMGTGSMTHNLSEFFGGAHEPAPYVVAFSRWVEDKIAQGDIGSLLNYRNLAPQAHRAHPTEDHFLPLFFVLGAAAQGSKVDYISRELMYGMLAMDAFAMAAG
jgi:4,5-DOPA dioxygenase extradiol